MDNNVINYTSILDDCGVDRLPNLDVIKNIAKLEEFYTSSEIVEIYNYFLNNIKNIELLIQVIKLSDNYKDSVILSTIINLLRTSFLEEEDGVNLKIICIKAIANYKDYSTLNLLLDCMNDKNEHYRVRLACADALGRIGNKYAVKPLIDLVEDDEEKSVYLKESATFALGLLGDTSAIDPLIKILDSKQGFLDRFSFLKEKIVEALGKLNINNKKVMKALKNSLMDSSSIVRINAIEAIMNSGDDDSINLIKPSLNDEDDEVKRNALIALYNICGRDILDEVISLPSYSEFLKIEAQDLINEYEESDE